MLLNIMVSIKEEPALDGSTERKMSLWTKKFLEFP